MKPTAIKNSDIYWTTIIFIIASITALEAPFTLVFKTNIQRWQITLDLIFSVLFCYDFFKNRQKNIQELKNRDLILDSKLHEKIFKKISILIDLFSCIPFDFISQFFLEQYFWPLRFLRIIRIFKIYTFLQKLAVIPRFLKIITIILGFFIVVNWIACGWIAIYPISSLNEDATTYFIKSVYWAITTLTTIGYGDITPNTNMGRIYTCFIMITGVGMYGIVIGNISRMLASADKHKDQTREKINDLILFMKHYKIPHQLQEVAINHYSHLYSKRMSDNDEKIISELPHALQKEMQTYMKINLILNIPIFHNCSFECLKLVSTKLEQVFTSPNENIIKIGETGDEMYIISHGDVEVILSTGERVATLHDGQIFGEIALVQELKRTANVKSLNYCDLYRLKKSDFHEIVKIYPFLLKNIESTTQRRSSDKKN